MLELIQKTDKEVSKRFFLKHFKRHLLEFLRELLMYKFLGKSPSSTFSINKEPLHGTALSPNSVIPSPVAQALTIIYYKTICRSKSTRACRVVELLPRFKAIISNANARTPAAGGPLCPAGCCLWWWEIALAIQLHSRYYYTYACRYIFKCTARRPAGISLFSIHCRWAHKSPMFKLWINQSFFYFADKVVCQIMFYKFDALIFL